MAIFLANPLRDSAEVQLPAWQWRDVVRVLARQFPHGPALAAQIDEAITGHAGPKPVRIRLTNAQIATVRGVLEATA